MMPKVLVALGLAASLSLAPAAAVAMRGRPWHQGEKDQEIKAEEGRDRIHGAARDSMTVPAEHGAGRALATELALPETD